MQLVVRDLGTGRGVSGEALGLTSLFVLAFTHGAKILLEQHCFTVGSPT